MIKAANSHLLLIQENHPTPGILLVLLALHHLFDLRDLGNRLCPVEKLREIKYVVFNIKDIFYLIKVREREREILPEVQVCPEVPSEKKNTVVRWCKFDNADSDSVTAVCSYLWTLWPHDAWNIIKSNFFSLSISLQTQIHVKFVGFMGT